jgi:hypothetical protein
MKRTTIFAEETLLNELRSLATERGASVAQVIHEALTDHVEKRRKGKPVSFIGAGGSGKRSIAEQHERLLWRKPAK